MKRKAFTLVEVIIAAVIVVTLATIIYPGYRNVVENAKAKTCAANLQALNSALYIYALDHDAMPGDLSQLPDAYIKKAYASMLKEKGAWQIKLARLIVDFDRQGKAYAGLMSNIGTLDPGLLTCPANDSGGTSYAFNINLQGMSSSAFLAVPANGAIVADAQNAAGFNANTLALRHKAFSLGNMAGDAYAQVVTKEKTVGVVAKAGTSIPGKTNPDYVINFNLTGKNTSSYDKH